MAPRIASRCLRASTSTSSSTCLIISPSSCLDIRSTPSRAFSSTPRPLTRLRRDMWRWINGPGAAFRDPLPGGTNYLNAYNERGQLIRAVEAGQEDSRSSNQKDRNDSGGEKSIGDALSSSKSGQASDDAATDTASGRAPLQESIDDLVPFPLNRQFRSQPVLSDALRNEIDRRVVEAGESVRIVSVDLGVEMSRVAAVVRLKAVERQWVQQNKPLASPYATAVLAMLPQTSFDPDARSPVTHESINDLPVHRDTQRQLFHPTAESRRFARPDAAAAFFSRGLLPADDRIPHPDLIATHRPVHGRTPLREYRVRGLRMRAANETAALALQAKQRAEREAAETVRVLPDGGRWEFRFRNVSVEAVGRDGRAPKGVGARYGFPHEDRKRGQIKIPRSVE